MNLEKYFVSVPYQLKKIHLEKGKTYPLHTKNPMIVFIEEKELWLSIHGIKNEMLSQKEMIFLPQAFSCVLSSTQTQDIYMLPVLDLSFFFFTYISNSFEKERVFCKEPFHTLTFHPLIQKFIYSTVAYQKDGILSQTLMELKIAELFTLLKLLYPKEELNSFFTPVLDPNHYFKMMVLSSYKKIKTVDEFARLSGLSISSFSRVFNNVFGMSPYKWMIQKKTQSLFTAIHHSSCPLKQIAFDFGFSSLPQMIDFCKKHMGQTPGEIRKKRIR